MNALAIDTHEVVKELKAVGFSEDQAEAVTRVVRRAQDLSARSMKVFAISAAVGDADVFFQMIWR